MDSNPPENPMSPMVSLRSQGQRLPPDSAESLTRKTNKSNNRGGLFGLRLIYPSIFALPVRSASIEVLIWARESLKHLLTYTIGKYEARDSLFKAFSHGYEPNAIEFSTLGCRQNSTDLATLLVSFTV